MFNTHNVETRTIINTVHGKVVAANWGNGVEYEHIDGHVHNATTLAANSTMMDVRTRHVSHECLHVHKDYDACDSSSGFHIPNHLLHQTCTVGWVKGTSSS